VAAVSAADDYIDDVVFEFLLFAKRRVTIVLQGLCTT